MTSSTKPVGLPPRLSQALVCVLAALQALPLTLISDVAHAQVAVTPQQTSPTQYRYDAQGNLTQVIEPDSTTTDFGADRLNRITQQTPPAKTEGAARPVIEYKYDGQDRLASVKDARGSYTGFLYRGLSDVVQVSADTGTSYFYDQADGQPVKRKNSRQDMMVMADPDELSRPRRINYVNGTTNLGHTLLSYDEYIATGSEQDNYGKGQLTRVEQYDAQGNLADATSLRYDQFGRVVWRCQFIAGIGSGSATSCPNSNAVRYGWGTPTDGPAAGKLRTITYPSGRQVRYAFDTLGRISDVTTAASATDTTGQAVASGVTYKAMGVSPSEHAFYSWKNGPIGGTPAMSTIRARGNAGWPTNITIGTGALDWLSLSAIHSLKYDTNGRVKSITSYRDGSNKVANYTYDPLGRLKQATLPGGITYGYEYDDNGNRTLKTSAAISTAYTYPSVSPSISNRLKTVQQGTAAAQTVSNDSLGNILQDPAGVAGAVTYTYEGRSPMPYARLGKSQGPGAEWRYVHNHFGERIRKSGFVYIPSSGGSPIGPPSYVGSTDTVFYYDLNGQLIAEHDASTGQVKREYIWMADIPVGVVAGAQPNQPISASNAATLYYVFSDHLNTPRMVTDTGGIRRWQSDIMAAEPFGASPPNETPAGQTADQAFVLNLRFPGQYFDKETATAYNYFRSYNPETGRYLQSDPIGLAGGLNTYGYVEGNPLMLIDPYGLWAWGDPLPDELVDFSAGMGDTLSLGLTDWIRDEMGTNGGVNKCSGSYGAGQWAGAGVAAATGVAGGLRAAGTRGAGKEFSHWIPNRMGGPRSLWNGNYVSKATHALSDPYRYRFMPRSWKAANPMPNRLSQQWTRLPNVYKGAGVGGAYGGAGMAMSDCTCPQ